VVQLPGPMTGELELPGLVPEGIRG
jgi:hypothetical protein